MNCNHNIINILPSEENSWNYADTYILICDKCNTIILNNISLNDVVKYIKENNPIINDGLKYLPLNLYSSIKF